jgi:hypothetical protein
MRKLTLVASATALAALFLVPGAQEASAGVPPALSAAKASAPPKIEMTRVQWRHGWGWHGGPGWGWRGGWRPGWGWGPWPYVAGAYYATRPYYYGPYPYYYGPEPYYAPPPCCGPRPYAPPAYEPPLK